MSNQQLPIKSYTELCLMNQPEIRFLPILGELNRKTKVIIKSSRHPDVLAGAIGVIDCYVVGGYGISITGSWLVAGSDRGVSISETRIVWYPKNELEEK